ncbi:MAG: hypothetical protein JNM04_05950 [Chthonomonas sp.]|nr:hypothetical protein [Chthonomonas sp.]
MITSNTIIRDRFVDQNKVRDFGGQPSHQSLALAKVSQMMQEQDVLDLPSSILERTRNFARRLVESVLLNDDTRVSIVGDAEEPEAMIIVHDFKLRRQVNLTVSSDSVNAWFKGISDEETIQNIDMEMIPFIAARLKSIG